RPEGLQRSRAGHSRYSFPAFHRGIRDIPAACVSLDLRRADLGRGKGERALVSIRSELVLSFPADHGGLSIFLPAVPPVEFQVRADTGIEYDARCVSCTGSILDRLDRIPKRLDRRGVYSR